MITLTVSEIIEIHSRLIRKTGGLDGVRDRGLLESGVFNISSGFEDMEVYPSAEEKAARLAFGIVNNHAFIDGNKRIGMLSMLMTLKLNHTEVQYTQKELIALGLGVADGSIDYDGILAWILEHRIVGYG